MPEVIPAPTVRVGNRPNVLAHILAEELTLERQVREALFLTFNVDLGFFETRLLGPCRAAGAAVTVVADASMFHPDVRAVRAAGSSYVVGLASMPGAFHPKLTVLVGERRALIAVGSGNVTMPGWHQNEELGTIITADHEGGCPTIVRDVAQWLRELVSTVQLSPLAIDAIGRTALALDTLVAGSSEIETGHLLVSSLRNPILDQLPVRGASHLNLYAPFHDERGAALGALIDRFRPSSVALAVQPGSTVISPTALSEVAQRKGVELVFEDANHETTTYRHGKLLEAIEPEGRRWALTGSANLTAAALLRTAEGGGNCELGVVSDVAQSLYPPTGATLSARELPAVSLKTKDAAEVSPAGSAVTSLLQATIHEGVLRVLLSRPSSVELFVQVSGFRDPPESYETIGTIPVGVTSADFNAALPATSRIRLRATDSHGPLWGFDYPLTDPATATRRIQPRGHNNPYERVDPIDLFNDLNLAEQWHDALNKVLHAQITTTLPRVSKPSGAHPSGSAAVTSADGWMTLESPDAWAKYSESAENRLGTTMYQFALGGLPQMATTPVSAPSAGTPQWVDRIDDTTDEFDDENPADDLVAELEVASEPDARRPNMRHRAELERRRYRAWLAKLSENMAHLDAIDRSGRAGLVLIGTQIDIWDERNGTTEWFDTLAAAIEALSFEPIPVRLRPQLAALATVGLYRMSEGLNRTSPATDESRYKQIRQALRALLPAATQEQLNANIESLNVGRTFKVDFDLVEDFKSSVLANDPQQDLLARIERALPEWEISSTNQQVFTITGSFSNPSQAAAQLIGLTTELPTVAVRATGSRDRWTTMARHGDHLAIVELSKSGRLTYRAYLLSSGVSALRIIEDEGLGGRVRLGSPPWVNASPEVLAVLREARVSLRGDLEL